MKKCIECGKDLRLLEGYQHPTLGRKTIVCSLCFDQITESVAKWADFILTNSFDMRDPKNNYKLDTEKKTKYHPNIEIFETKIA
jgi:hypothetical protein